MSLLTLAVALTLFGAASASSSASPVSHGPWSQSLLTRADIASGAVFVPASSSSASASSFLVGFEIGDLCMEPCSEPIVRLDLRSGSFKVGPVLPPLSTIETVGRRVLVFAAHQVTATGYMIGGFFVRTLNVASFRLGPPERLHFLGIAGGDVIGVVSGTDDLWIAGSGGLCGFGTPTPEKSYVGSGLLTGPEAESRYHRMGESSTTSPVRRKLGSTAAYSSGRSVPALGACLLLPGVWRMFRPSHLWIEASGSRRSLSGTRPPSCSVPVISGS